VGVAYGASVEFEDAFEELKGCHVGFGVCLSNLTGYVGLDEASCTVDLVRDSEIEADKLQIVKWYQAYADADELETDATSDTNTTYLARLAEGTTVADYKAALTDASATFADFVFCEGSTWSVVTGEVDDVAEIGFKFRLTEKLRYAPIDYFYEEDASSSAHFIRVLTPPTAARGVDLATQLQERASAATKGAVTIASSKTLVVGGVETLLVHNTGSEREMKEWIASEPEVIWVERVRLSETTNYDAVALTQSGTELFPKEDRSEEATPFWQKGILGQGQIVGVGDSGLDTSSCFFRDSSVDESANTLARIALGTNVEVGPNLTVEFLLDVDTRTDYPDHRKLVQYIGFADGAENSTSGHGTHVAGSIAGSLEGNNLDATAGAAPDNATRFDAIDFQGMAPEAKIAFFDIGKFDVPRYVFPPDDTYDMYQPAYEVGARIHSNSWGSAVQYYSVSMVSSDDFVFKHQDFLPLFAAGNSGRNGLLTAGTPSVAKNLMCIGASNNAERAWAFFRETLPLVAPDRTCLIKLEGGKCGDNMAEFSGNGPTWDGRIKPDVSAPGSRIFSAYSAPAQDGEFVDTCEAVSKAGTSMATPVTAGNAALVRQFFMDGYHPSGEATPGNAFEPMGALVKAVLVNGADLMVGLNWNDTALNTDAPDVFQGFGRINLGNNLRLSGVNEKAMTIVDGDFADMPTFTETGELKTYTIDITEGQAGGILKATLVWFEPASSVTAALLRVNDLDISVKKPDGTVVFANGLDTYDRINQVEQVQITNPESGTYTVTVEASAIRMNDVAQPFAVVISANIFDDVEPTRAPTTKLPTREPTNSPTSTPTTSAPTEAEVTEEPVNQNFTLWISLVGGTMASVAMLYCGIKYFSPSEEDLQENSGAIVSGKSRPV